MRSPQEIASSLTLLADLMDISGENEFKIRAHRAAADICQNYAGSAESLLARIASPGIPKIGDNLAKKITDLSERADIPELAQLSEMVPLSVLELRRVPGLGPKKVKSLWQELKIKNLEELEAACCAGQIQKIKGFSDKAEEKILEGLGFIKRFKGMMLLSRATYLFELQSALIRQNFPDARFEVTADLRRSTEIVSSVEILLTGVDPQALVSFNQRSGLFVSIEVLPERIEMLTTRSELFKIHLCTQDQFAKCLLETTGPDEFVSWIGSKIDFKSSFKEEKEIFDAAGFVYVIPEQREIERRTFWDSTEADHKKVVQVSDIRGVIHCHSTFSDGADELRAMAIAAKDQGFEYLGIADHSVSARYAGGLTIEKVKKQHALISEINSELTPFRVLRGIESDITSAGDLDYPSEILESFDFVIASIHSGFQMSREEMTARIIKALRNPYTNILGHPTGRLLMERDAYAVDLEEVIKVAAQEKVVIEINASPYRLDLDWRLIPFALNHGAKFSINPDAHRIAGFKDISFGVACARKAGLEKQHVINAHGVEHFLACLAP